MSPLLKKSPQKKNSLIAALQKNSKNISFHTPGHNSTLPGVFTKFDTTELAYSDNLLEARGVIKELEDKISKVYTVRRAFISTNGATNCILTAVYALKAYGGFLIFGDAHTSVYNAIRLSKASAFPCATLQDSPPDGAKCLVVTYPDYFGNCPDLIQAKRYADRYGLFLLVDSSHGSHFVFNKKFPVAATRYADLAVCSLHKTLPVATGGAVLLCNRQELTDRVTLARRFFHSTSPSYITLASIERAMNLFVSKGEEMYEKTFAAVCGFTKADTGCFYCAKTADVTRLVMCSRFEGAAVSAELSKRGIDVEMSADNKIVAIVTPYNYKKLPKLARALKKISELSLPEYKQVKKSERQAVVTPVLSDAYELVAPEAAVGRRAYCDMGVYPPGVPAVVAGEVITPEAAELLEKNASNSFGLVNGLAAVLL
ncbi:MAG: hypothetical protein PHC84_01125 [Clostridia bacterium]|nr:hypothetical protein [Clostridia bacterium]